MPGHGFPGEWEKMARERIRLRFTKRDTLRFIGHHDLLRLIERLLRRAGMPVEMTAGFHPKQKVSYVSALPLGMASDDEVMEVVFAAEFTLEEILARLNAASVDGLSFFGAVRLPEDGKKSSAVSFLYEIPLPPTPPADLSGRIATLMAADSMMVTKANGKETDLRGSLLSLELERNAMTASFAVRPGPEAGVRELMVYLGMEDDLYKSVFPCRKATRLAE